MPVLNMYIVAMFAMIGIHTAWANESPKCYIYSKADGPERNSEVVNKIENWCYQNLTYPRGSVFIYNIDSERVRPEVSFVVTQDGDIIHGSLLNGETTFHKVRAKEFNPISIPLHAPLIEPSFQLQDVKMLESAQQTLNTLLNSPAEFHSLAISGGMSLQESARAAHVPWRGYWWSQKRKRLWSRPNSPLAKYDQLVKAQSGTDPGSVSWERARHNGNSGWTGHCNGWAASSILRREPSSIKTISGITFSVSDQKGILAAADYCVDSVLFGRRNNGNGDRRDIHPALFHKTLTYYIGNLRKPLAYDYRADSIVYNHVISGYDMQMDPTGPNTFHVTAILRAHKYDGGTFESPAPAPTYQRIYKYTLTVDSSGNPTGGRWLSTNPDFLWVPLSPRECANKDHNITEEWVQKIIY